MIKKIVLMLLIFALGMLAFTYLIKSVGNIAFLFLGGFVFLIVFVGYRIIQHPKK